MQKIKKNAWKIWWYLILSLICLVMVFPFIWLLSSSFKFERNIFVIPPQLIPRPATLQNFVGVFRDTKFLKWMMNSTYIALIVVVCGSLVSSMAGFAYSKLRFRGRSFLFLLPLCGLMIPNEVILIPMFKMWTWLGAIHTHIPLILPNIVGVGGMFGVFLFRQFYMSIPT